MYRNCLIRFGISHYEGIADESCEAKEDARKIIKEIKTKQPYYYRYKNIITQYEFQILLQGDVKFLFSARCWLDCKSNIGNGYILIFQHDIPAKHFIEWKHWYSFMRDYELRDIIVNINANELKEKLNDDSDNDTFLILNNTEINNIFFGYPIVNALKDIRNQLTEEQYLAYAKEVAKKNNQIQYGLALEGSIEGGFSLLHCKKSLCSKLIKKWTNYILLQTKISVETFKKIFAKYSLPSCIKKLNDWHKENKKKKKPKKYHFPRLNKREAVLMFIKYLLIFNELAHHTINFKTNIKLSSFMILIIKILEIFYYAHKKKLNTEELNECYELCQSLHNYCSTFHREYVKFLFKTKYCISEKIYSISIYIY